MSTGRDYWRSLDDRAQTPEFQNFVMREFPGLAEELLSPSRRQFLKVMGASLAMAGLTGCRWPREAIVPYNQRPEGRIPGRAMYYATTMEVGGVGTGLLVKSYDGRPIKIEGNERHPLSLGASGSWQQAAVLEMYDPDRSTGALASADNPRIPAADSVKGRFLPFVREHFAKVRGAAGAGLCVLSEASASPTLAALREQLLKACPQAAWFEYEPVSYDNARAGTILAFGQPFRPQYRLHDIERNQRLADVVVCLDADLLGLHPAALRLTREFARGRTADDQDHTMSRWYAVESNVSLTGSNADHRFAVRSSDVAQVAWEIAAALAANGVNIPVKLNAPARFAFAQKIAADLAAHRGRSLVCAGPSQPPEVHAAAHLINNALENIGKTIVYTPKADPQRPTHAEAIAALTKRMSAGQVSTLAIIGGNPAYNAPADLDFAGALGKVETSIHLSLYDDETSRLCSWHAPRAHFLESWGDAAAYDGTVSLQQPLIEPLYHGLSAIELVALMAGDEVTSGYELTRRTFKSRLAAGQDFEAAWRRALHDGVVEGAPDPQTPTIVTAAWSRISGFFEAPRPAGDMELVFVPDARVYDGRFANNGWLQELPDPLTKLTWDNAALIAPATARKLGIQKNGDQLRIRTAGRELTLPAYVLPGQAPDSITLPLGYGRGPAGGRVAEGAGLDTYRLRTTGGWHMAFGEAARVSGRYELATTQDHHAIDSAVGGDEKQVRIPILVREGTLRQYRAYLGAGHAPGHNGADHDHGAPGAAERDTQAAGYTGGDRPPPPHNFAGEVVHREVHPLPLVQLFGAHEAPDAPKWGMAIDLTKCTGCSACVTACHAENNVPVVGKAEVYLGREMHWIRIDRYFRGAPDAPTIVHQPVTCHQCENAPCEQVCPVAATTHDDDGLNVMVYNRCIGTRYCSNNCPYKVRRFNWFYNHYGPAHPRSRSGSTTVFQTFDIKNTPNMLPQTKLTEIEKLRMNPDVTVRSRGVMEKCTFCVQRINAAKIAHRNEQVSPRPNHAEPDYIPDGKFTTACAQACPAEAIVFGDLRQRENKVAQAHGHERAYEMLQELNVRARLRYLARLRNPLEEGAAADAAHAHG